MTLPAQTIAPGQLRDKFQREVRGLIREQILERLWSKDVSLWPEELLDRNRALANLAWLKLPEGLGPFLESVRREEQAADADGLVDHALLACESVKFCARALLGFSGITFGRKLVVLDSKSPEAIQQNEERLDLSRTLFVLANKEHYGLEDQCLFLYFRDKLQETEGRGASRHFISQTEEQSYLASVSRAYPFREILHDPPGIPPAYCSLLHFSALLTALRAAEPEHILAEVDQVRRDFTLPNLSAGNAALQLAAFLTSAIDGHRSYLAFLASPSLIAYTQRLGQLLGVGLAREGPGLIPIAGAVPRSTHAFENEAAFALLTYPGDDDWELAEASARFQSSDIPFLQVEIRQPFDLLTETFKWEVATILACARRGIDPFDVPDNRVPRVIASELLERLSQGQDPLRRSPRLVEGLIQLHAEGITRREISTLSMVEALRSFLRVPTPGRHVTLLVNITPTEAVNATFSAIRGKLTETLNRPVLLAYGPRAGEHHGYLFREELPYGPCIVLTADPPVDRAIPGARYSFAQLHQALALSEYDTLAHWQRPVILLHLTHGFPAALEQLERIFEQALHRFRR